VRSISNTLSGVDSAELPEAVKSFRRFADSASTFLDSTDPKTLGPKLAGTLDQTRALLARINVLLADPAAETLIPDASRTMAGVRKLVDTAGPDTAQLLRDSKETAASLKVSAKELEKFLADPETSRQLAEIPGAIQQARDTVAEVRSAAKRLNAVMGRVEQLSSSQQANVEGILESARGLVDNLKELTGEAKRYPSGMLFGPAPVKSPLGGQ